LVNNLYRDLNGSALVEYTIVFPLFIVLMLGNVDAAYMFYDWSLANKAAYIGARAAVVSDAVALNASGKSIADVSSFGYTTDQFTVLGELCVNNSDGTPQKTSKGNNYCNVVGPVICTGSSNATTVVTCDNGQTPKKTAFSNGSTGVFEKMQSIFSRLQRQNVQIVYTTNGAGFVGGQTFNVTVSITGMTHQFYFINGLIKILSAGVPAVASAPNIPTYSTTLQSEALLSQ